MTTSKDYPDLTYTQARGDGGPRTTTQALLLHATDNTATAADEATYATRRDDETSAHYYIDDHTTIQTLPIDHIAWGALHHANQITIQYEMCGRSNQITEATLNRTAQQVARDAHRYAIPIRKITPAQLAAGVTGICGHADATIAFPQDGGTHTDPGPNFPWDHFITLVQHYTQPQPPPPTTHTTIEVAPWPGYPSTMEQIADKAYGDRHRWRDIFDSPLNTTLKTRAAGDPTRIQPGWKFLIP